MSLLKNEDGTLIIRSKLYNTLLGLTTLLLAGCTTAALNSEGEKVTLVDSLSASDMLNYNRVADLQCTGMLSIENCRNDLRNQGGQKGATIVRITSVEPSFCGMDGFSKDAKKNCFNMYGDAFTPKAVPSR